MTHGRKMYGPFLMRPLERSFIQILRSTDGEEVMIRSEEWGEGHDTCRVWHRRQEKMPWRFIESDNGNPFCLRLEDKFVSTAEQLTVMQNQAWAMATP